MFSPFPDQVFQEEEEKHEMALVRVSFSKVIKNKKIIISKW